jgi:hypothetical protein
MQKPDYRPGNSSSDSLLLICPLKAHAIDLQHPYEKQELKLSTFFRLRFLCSRNLVLNCFYIYDLKSLTVLCRLVMSTKPH